MSTGSHLAGCSRKTSIKKHKLSCQLSKKYKKPERRKSWIEQSKKKEKGKFL